MARQPRLRKSNRVKARNVPTAGGREQTTMRLSASLRADLDKIAEREGFTRSFLVERALTEFVAAHRRKVPTKEEVFS